MNTAKDMFICEQFVDSCVAYVRAAWRHSLFLTVTCLLPMSYERLFASKKTGITIYKISGKYNLNNMTASNEIGRVATEVAWVHKSKYGMNLWQHCLSRDFCKTTVDPGASSWLCHMHLGLRTTRSKCPVLKCECHHGNLSTFNWMRTSGVQQTPH